MSPAFPALRAVALALGVMMCGPRATNVGQTVLVAVAFLFEDCQCSLLDLGGARPQLKLPPNLRRDRARTLQTKRYLGPVQDGPAVEKLDDAGLDCGRPIVRDNDSGNDSVAVIVESNCQC